MQRIVRFAQARLCPAERTARECQLVAVPERWTPVDTARCSLAVWLRAGSRALGVAFLASIPTLLMWLSPAAMANHSVQELVTTGPSGGNGSVDAGFVGASHDGARTFFETEEALVAADTDANCTDYDPAKPPRKCTDVYQRFDGVTTLLSTGPAGSNGAFDAEFAGSSADGLHVFFETQEALVSSDTDTAVDVYEAVAGTTALVSTGPAGGNGDAYATFAGASADGARTFFLTSEALVGSDTDTAYDVYERSGSVTALISTGPSGGNSSAYSARYVGASTTGTTVYFETDESLVSTDSDGGCVIPGDTGPPGPCTDVYSRSGGSTTRVSIGPVGGNGAFDASFVAASENGSRAVFSTDEALTSNDTDARFDLYERTASTTTLLTIGPNGGNGGDASFDVSDASVSANGLHVFFETFEPLVASDTDASGDVYDRSAGVTTLLSTGSGGGNGAFDASLEKGSPDGLRVYFSTAEGLTSGDTDSRDDVYQRSGGVTSLLSTGSSGGNGDFDATFREASSSGSRVFFETEEPLVSADTDSTDDVYERFSGTTSRVSAGAAGGNGSFNADLVDISRDGLTVFVDTHETLVSSDADGERDTYAIRVAPPTPPSPCTHRFTTSDIFDFQGQMNNLPTAAVACLDAGTYGTEAQTQKITNDRLTIRSTPGHLARINARLWITGEGEGQGDRVTISHLVLDGATYPLPTAPTVSVNADRVVFERVNVSNSYSAVSCFNNDGTLEGGPAYRLVIQNSKIYDCGASASQHGVHLGSVDEGTVVHNWIYENGGEGVRIGSATSSATVANNVIADNCAVGGGSCNGNLTYVEAGNTGLVHDNVVADNTVAFPHAGLNAVSVQVNGEDNLFASNCVWRSDGTHGVSLPQPPFVVDFVTANPNFVDHTTPVHAWRNYGIPNDPNHPCAGNVPTTPPGP
jgi:hypothetical protein